MHERDYFSADVTQLRADLAVALRAAARHGLSEGVCNHFSVELPDGSGRCLLNPRGLMWSEVGADDIVLIDQHGQVLAGTQISTGEKPPRYTRILLNLLHLW